jgi:hypothetical protein
VASGAIWTYRARWVLFRSLATSTNYPVSHAITSAAASVEPRGKPPSPPRVNAGFEPASAQYRGGASEAAKLTRTLTVPPVWHRRHRSLCLPKISHLGFSIGCSNRIESVHRAIVGAPFASGSIGQGAETAFAFGQRMPTTPSTRFPVFNARLGLSWQLDSVDLRRSLWEVPHGSSHLQSLP